MKKFLLGLLAIAFVCFSVSAFAIGKKGKKKRTAVPKGTYSVNVKDSTVTMLRSDSTEFAAMVPAGFKVDIKPR